MWLVLVEIIECSFSWFGNERTYTNSIIKDVFLKHKIYIKDIFLKHKIILCHNKSKIHLHGVDMRDIQVYIYNDNA